MSQKLVTTIVMMMVLTSLVVGCGGAAPTTAPEPTEAESAEEETTGEEAAGEEMAEEEAANEAPAELTPVTLQLQWVPQSQFAGFYAALAEGYYEEEGLEVTIKPGAVEIVPQQVVATGGAEFGVAWLPKVLASIEQGADLVNIAQIFQRSGTVQVSWADSGITSPEDWAGKKVGTWGFGNEAEVFAALRKVGLDPNNPEDVEIIQQPFDMSLLLNREIDAAQAETYNEYAQLLEATNPETGELYQPEDFVVISYEDVGTAMLQDGIFVRGDWIEEEANQDIAVRFLRGTFKGWIYCRDNADACVQIVLDAGTALGQGHMTWMMNEVNALIWPSPGGIGIMNEEAWQQTADISHEFGIIEEPATQDAYRTDLAEQALEGIEGDVEGLDWQRADVEITPGGE